MYMPRNEPKPYDNKSNPGKYKTHVSFVRNCGCILTVR